ncbi:MAG: D-psicose/D-tagatose/L-ribulose 3-epimerase [Gaiellaceae bacterium]|nr:D-psicose/D-tagatose/L-ribulose 3-epimerase [Gaiellaceae bacterium]
MKLGMNMLLWSTDVSGTEYDATFAMLKDAGFDGVEVPIFDREVDKYAALGERLEDLGLERLAVSARGADDNPIAEDPAVRAEAAAATRANLDSAAALGASLICGPLGAPLGVFSGAPPTAEEKARAVEYLREVAPYAEERGVTIVLEYLNRFEMYLTNTAADLAALVREVDHPSVRMMYDTFHAHIEEKDPRAALQDCKDVLAHVHLSENDRSTPGAGQVEWDETFAALQEIDYDGWVVIEAFGDALPELAGATKIWRRMFESEERLARDGAAFIRSGLSL